MTPVDNTLSLFKITVISMTVFSNSLVNYSFGTVQLALCFLSIILNTLVILQHSPKTTKIASLLFCLLAASDQIKSLLSVYPSYNFLKPELDYECTPVIGQKVYSAAVLIFLDTGIFITLMLNIHRYISVEWPTYKIKRSVVTLILTVYFGFESVTKGFFWVFSKRSKSLLWNPLTQFVSVVKNESGAPRERKVFLITVYTMLACFSIIFMLTLRTLYVLKVRRLYITGKSPDTSSYQTKV